MSSFHLQFLCIHLIFLVKSQAQLSSIAKEVTALYVFGDSVFDTGNKYSANSLANATYFPYGIDFSFPPSGRFTNGRTIADFLSKKKPKNDFSSSRVLYVPMQTVICDMEKWAGLSLNLTLSVPYSLIRDDKNSESTKGFIYASAAAGILPDTGHALEGTMSLDKQIMLFKETVENYLPQHFKNAEEISHYLSNSIFAILIGSNDYLGNYLQPDYNSATNGYSRDEFANLLVSVLERQLKDLYNIGARKILMFEIAPLGCTPFLVSRVKPEGRCVDAVNSMVTQFNGKLYFKLIDLASSLEGMTFYLAQIYRLVYDIVENPDRFGLKNSTDPCCLVQQDGRRCIPDENPCSERDLYVFWDQIHLTEAAYKIISSKCFNDSTICMRIGNVNVDGKVTISGQPRHKKNIIFFYCNYFILTITVLISLF